MEINYALASLILFLSSLFIVIRQWRNKKQNKLPPGPWKLPIIGSLHHLIGGGLPHRILRNLSQRYGPLMYLQMGQVPTVVISSPSMAKQVLKTHDLAFVNRPQLTSTNIIFYNNKDIAFSQYGDYWRQMRKICTIELLCTKMVKSYGAVREDELSSLISSIRSTMGNTINMTQIIFLFSNSIICRSAFGKICKNRDEFLTILKEVLLLGAGFFVGDLFPTWKLLHNLRGEKTRMVNAHKKVDAVMEEILNEHIKNKAAGKKGNGEFGDEDLVDVFLRVKENSQLQFPIANENIKAVILDIFLAGTETSFTVIIWAFTEMMRNPHIMAKAQSEVRRVFKGKKNYDEEDVEKLTYLNLVIKETLRLHAPVPLLAPKECREETVIDGYTIPLNTRVLVNAWAIGRDPESWDDPDNFIPERFEKSSVDFTGNHFEFIPFGAGRRICPGVVFGLANVGLPLAQLLYHFDWKLPNGTNPNDLDMTETHGLSAARQKDLYLIAIDHKNNEE
ncbi:premnaspirodiene oxygenase-like [Solanum stenotomum]|uniref:premnaspirodiene oxygenase-like n=1 Tax=Solanum stenotomum TaxID=172797 RepID=UPI0020D1D51B|nr:premnaspirodiene oxygenase-like [Solanum stenotomum]